jgi:PIN domain nuclease of toxin-antitoxin system
MQPFLLDTHTFLWALLDPGKLSQNTAEIIKEPSNEVFISVISIWEITLKYSLGKLDLKGGYPEDLLNVMSEIDFNILEMDAQTMATFYRLPTGFHKDPFDRLLCWQAI